MSGTVGWRTRLYGRLDRPGVRSLADRAPTTVTGWIGHRIRGSSERPKLDRAVISWEGHRFDVEAPPAVLARARRRWIENTICRAMRGATTAGPANGTVVDVGANVGFVSLVAADSLGSDGCLIAVEADPAVAETTGRNLQANGFADHSVVVPEPATGPEGGDTVDHLVARHGRGPVVALKIDTDGDDLAVLRGAEQTIAHDHPLVVVEITDDAGAILDLLATHYPVVGDQFGEPARREDPPVNAIAWTADYAPLLEPVD